MAAQISFEVYFQDTGGWMLHSRHGANDREEAFAEARTLEADALKPVRIVREIHYEETGDSDEEVIWAGKIKPTTKATPEGPKVARVPRPDYDHLTTEKALVKTLMANAKTETSAYNGPNRRVGPRRAVAPPKKLSNYTFNMVMISVAAVVSGLVIAGGAGKVMQYSMAGMETATRLFIMMMIFGLVSLIIAVILAFVYLPVKELFGSARKGPNQPPQGEVKPRGGVDRRRSSGQMVVESSAQILEKLKREQELAAAKDSAVFADTMRPSVKPAEATMAVEPPLGRPKSSPLGIEAAAAASPPASPPPSGKAPEGKGPEGKGPEGKGPEGKGPEGKVGPAAAKPVEPPIVPPYSERVKAEILQFLSGAVSIIKTIHPQLDTYDRFGVNLFVAGACEALAESHKLRASAFQYLVREALANIGTKPDAAQQLNRQLNTYRQATRYNDMVSLGRTAMQTHLKGMSDPFLAVPKAFKTWDALKVRGYSATDATILVSDWAGFKDPTLSTDSALGQRLAYEHAMIARHAMAQFSGKEISQTDHSVVISFDDPLRALLAAIEIQEKVTHYAKHDLDADKLLHVRMAINSGKIEGGANPVAGIARVALGLAEKSDDTMILISQSTRASIPEPSRFVVRDRGLITSDGFLEPVQAFSITWGDSVAPSEPSSTAKESATMPPATP